MAGLAAYLRVPTDVLRLRAVSMPAPTPAAHTAGSYAAQAAAAPSGALELEVTTAPPADAVGQLATLSARLTELYTATSQAGSVLGAKVYAMSVPLVVVTVTYPPPGYVASPPPPPSAATPVATPPPQQRRWKPLRGPSPPFAFPLPRGYSNAPTGGSPCRIGTQPAPEGARTVPFLGDPKRAPPSLPSRQ